MSKIMIVDDGLVGRIRRDEGRERFYINYGADRSLALEDCVDIEAREKTAPYNLSSMIQGDHEFYLSRFPIVPVNNPNFFYELSSTENEAHELRMKAIARKNFDVERIVEEVEFVNPDFLFVDLGLPYLVEDSFMKNFLARAKHASPKHIGLPPINKFYMIKKRDAISAEGKEQYAISFNSYLEGGLNSDSINRWIGAAGGVALGGALFKKNIPFSFWTTDVGHAQESLIAAEIYGLVSENDTLSAIEHCFESFYDSEGHAIKKRILPLSNKNGNILIEGKSSILNDVGILDRAIEAVKDFQENWNL